MLAWLSTALSPRVSSSQRACLDTDPQGFYFVLGAAGGSGGRGGRGGHGGGRQKHPRDLEEDGEDECSQLPHQSVQPTASTAGGAGSAVKGAAAGRGGRGGGGNSQQLRIPSGFSVLQRNGRTAQVTTCELNALNARLRDASNDCLVLTEQVGGREEGVTHYLPHTARTAAFRLHSAEAISGTSHVPACLPACLPPPCPGAGGPVPEDRGCLHAAAASPG